MDDQQRQRYSRQILLPQIGVAGQERLARARVLLIGAGGLGSAAAMYLAVAGVGRLVLCDDDRVELANLQRQILHGTADLDRPKVESARERLAALNPHVEIETVYGRLSGPALDAAVARADAVVDASDNFATRFALNAACVRQRTPLISGAAIRFQGQVGVFLLDRPGSPCYQCLFRDDDTAGETCSEQGILAPVVGIVGSVQATETIKALLGLPTLAGRLLQIDALAVTWRSTGFARDPACPTCGRGGNGAQPAAVTRDRTPAL